MIVAQGDTATPCGALPVGISEFRSTPSKGLAQAESYRPFRTEFRRRIAQIARLHYDRRAGAVDNLLAGRVDAGHVPCRKDRRPFFPCCSSTRARAAARARRQTVAHLHRRENYGRALDLYAPPVDLLRMIRTSRGLFGSPNRVDRASRTSAARTYRLVVHLTPAFIAELMRLAGITITRLQEEAPFSVHRAGRRENTERGSGQHRRPTLVAPQADAIVPSVRCWLDRARRRLPSMRTRRSAMAAAARASPQASANSCALWRRRRCCMRSMTQRYLSTDSGNEPEHG